MISSILCVILILISVILKWVGEAKDNDQIWWSGFGCFILAYMSFYVGIIIEPIK